MAHCSKEVSSINRHGQVGYTSSANPHILPVHAIHPNLCSSNSLGYEETVNFGEMARMGCLRLII